MSGRVVVLTGGVGGAKLVLGLARLMPPSDITVIVNTGDDFRHLGLCVSPDIDTLLYTLSGQSNLAQGWGRQDETWNFMAALRSLGGEDWFALGDGDLALHVLRTRALSSGKNLSEITRKFARAWDIAADIRPMSDQPVQTILSTDDGDMPFQHYFVKRRCEPRVHTIRFEGAAAARPAAGLSEAIADPSNRAILIAPSNPYLSVDPILAVPGVRKALAAAPAPVIAVTPIIAGEAVKGPTAKLMKEFGLEVSPSTIASHYEGVISGLLVDERDRGMSVAIRHQFANTLMNTLDDRVRVATAALDFAAVCQKKCARTTL